MKEFDLKKFMKKEIVFLGKNEMNLKQSPVSGQFVEIEDEKFYRISNFHEMPDFFISIVSDSDHWMFISSNGSLSAGRKNRDNALFPYYTVDKIHDYKGKTGSHSYFLIKENGKSFLWEPFTDDSLKFYNTSRNIYKNIYGNKIIFEEINNDLGLCFRYGWSNSEKYGFVKKSELINLSEKKITVNILDGIQNILPHGVGYDFQNEYSNLADAYKKSERVEDSTLGLFMLSAIPVDRAEPSEALFATTVWATGLDGEIKILLSEEQVPDFVRGNAVDSEENIRAQRGAYFINTSISLVPAATKSWLTIAEINQSTTQTANLNHFIVTTKNAADLILEDVQKGAENLKRMVSLADGFQITNTEICYARHYTNTLFNIMRGGIFLNSYLIEKNDFQLYLWQINRLLTKEYSNWLERLPGKLTYAELQQQAAKTNDADLCRIAGEYLPLTFSRRHGDPSRPWNRFSIETKNPDGSVKFYYEGNWRDIFQNWEALCYSFPDFTEGVISKFVNSTTIDGYNPYRIMRDGIDWETPDPDDPWAYIGYWGDHQIIYLQKLLELSNNFHPGRLEKMLTREIYTYANVPYRLKSYEDIVKDPKDTVVFDYELNKKIKTEATHLGADASLLKSKQNDEIYKVNFTEKILVTLLSKICNFIPEAGIWMNTQRPEWNDANNALVGNGASMVTLYYLRRFLQFWDDKFGSVAVNSITISEEVASLLSAIQRFLNENIDLINGSFTDKDRRRFADALGKAHAKYRNEIYAYSFSGEKEKIQIKDLVAFMRLCIKYLDHSIAANKRNDDLYHAYNLISIKKDGIAVRHLYEMLEGQVAVLSSGVLSVKESLAVLDALKKSEMFREDQYSYMLYPDRILPGFMEKNWIPEEAVNTSTLLQKLIDDKEPSIINRDALGEYHFNSNFRNAAILEKALDNLRFGGYSHLVEVEKDKILAIYEEVFDHQSFTGRSGTFYGYEGLGSIYWHMVSKLLLATQECFFRALAANADTKTLGKFKEHYYEIKAGIGLYKSPELYGAFPTDAYSHTPANAGVKQPGLTGQVKEDVIARLGELGLTIRSGSIVFDAALINEEEILENNQVFEYYDMHGKPAQITLAKGQAGFTFCLVPFIVSKSNSNLITVFYSDGSTEEIPGNILNHRISSLIFSRNGEVNRVQIKSKF
jgi:hypothetical protein